MRKLYGILFITVILCSGCTSRQAADRVVRVDKAMQMYGSLSETARDSLLNGIRPEVYAFFTVLGNEAPGDSDMATWSQSDVVRVFQPDVDSVFDDLDDLETQIAHICSVDRKHRWGLTDSVRFAAVSWGRPQPIVRCNDVMLIALNHYLGEAYPGYSHWDYYRRQEKVPRKIPYDLAGALAATKYPFVTRETPTLLSWMLYEGALMHARMELLDQPELCVALGYAPDVLEYLEDNTHGIWDDMRMMRIVYTTDPATIDRYIAPSPVTPLVHHSVPGRVGRYIGYKIVKSYLRHHPGTDLDYLLSPRFYDNPQSLIDSGF